MKNIIHGNNFFIWLTGSIILSYLMGLTLGDRIPKAELMFVCFLIGFISVIIGLYLDNYPTKP